MRLRNRHVPAAAVLAIVACSSGTRIPGNRPILGWWGTGAAAQRIPLIVEGFDGPDPHACSPDPTRAYIGELFAHGLDDVEVPWHWAPVRSGSEPKRPTLDQPEYFLAGALEAVNDASDDVLADHPFGLDVNSGVLPDPAFAFLADGGDEGGAEATLHTEVETRTFPRAALGFVPQAGDRTLMRGVWVLDCGHPPYGTEMHPPTFLNYARASDADTTLSAAVVMPYRSSLLFNPDVALATDFTNTARFKKGDTAPFSTALVNAVVHAVVNHDDRLSTHALMTANRFETLDWTVCAPLPKPAGATLDASWRFTMRSGVALRAERHDADGCVRFTATMGAGYVPMPLVWVGADWPWDQLSASASEQLGQPIDVRLAILQILTDQGLDPSTVPAFQADHPPVIDAYPALAPRPNASADAPTNLDENADDQPFPLYGRVRVRWIH